MKKIYIPCFVNAVFFLLASIPINLFAQLQIPIDTTTGKISYTEINYADSLTKKELFSRALEWVALNYKSANDVVQMKDFDAGKIIVKGLFHEPLTRALTTYDVSVFHTIIISVKDGKCKIQITDLNYKYYIEGGFIGSTYMAGRWMEGGLEDFIHLTMYKKANEKFIAACNSEIKQTLDSFSAFIQKPTGNQKDDW